ncbi:MAG: chromosomal replication initiator protein DnaA [Patiriisocius sp.]|uniref:chromosomal replication initiator protein DnaA n=1 Tax=Patiriisocius sp. TaxID=2822396 RepID=UPI003EFB066E
MSKTANTVWNSCLEFIKENISSQAYNTWFEPIKAVKIHEKTLTIQVPSKFFYEWIEEHYSKLLKVALTKELGDEGKLVYVIRMENTYGNKQPFTERIPSSNRTNVGLSQNTQTPIENKSLDLKNPFIIAGIRNLKIESQLNPNYNFESFLEGESNRLARSAGIAVSNKPGGTSFNPLFVFGGVGLGKTHLAHAIGVNIKDKYPEKTVLYISAEKFVQQYSESVQKNNRNDFIHFYQVIDVLIMDDIQLLSGKAGTQDVFFHIFNHLHQNGRQIIITSDKSPVDMIDIEQRLLSRFKWGLSAELNHPDYETRVAIIKNKLYRDGVEVPDDIVEFLANNIKTNIRELEGAIISLIAHSSFNKREITINLAKKVIDNYVKNSERIFHDSIKMPKILRNAFLKYLISFDDYVKETKGPSIDFRIIKTQEGIDFEMTLYGDSDIESIKGYLDEYIDLAKHDEINLKDKIVIKELKKEIAFLEVKYNAQVSQFRTDLEIADFKNSYLEDVNRELRTLFLSPYMVPINISLTQNQEQHQEQEIEVLFAFEEKEICDIQDAFDDIKKSITDIDLRREAEIIQNELDTFSEENIEEAKNGKFKNKFRRFFSSLKRGFERMKWTNEALESFVKGKDTLLKFAEYIGVDIKEVIELIIKSLS